MRALVALTLCGYIIANPMWSVAADLEDTVNFRQYSEQLSSSGQPTAAQLQDAAELGYQRIVYLAFTDDETAIEKEDRVVKSAGMNYVHIPVDFHDPTVEDFDAFAGAMLQNSDARTLVHCQVNFRASTFSFLYSVIYRNAPVLEAKKDLDDVWALNEDWYRLIVKTLEHHGLSHECDGCDWGEYTFLKN